MAMVEGLAAPDPALRGVTAGSSNSLGQHTRSVTTVANVTVDCESENEPTAVEWSRREQVYDRFDLNEPEVEREPLDSDR
jgi:hypothetical protein